MARAGLGLAAGIATGLNTGYGMARDAYQDEQTQKRQAVEDVYRARADERADQASKRENERLDLARTTEQRQQQRLDEAERQQRLTQTTSLLEKSNADIIARSRARTGAGMPVDPGDAEEYGRNQAALARIRQDALNFFSRVQAGTEDINKASPGDLYMNFTAATGMKPEELAEMPKHINDIQAGLQTGNQGLVVQATNGLMAPQLRRGVGAESPYGGTIVRKEIIGLDPAIDANGKEHPNRFIPRLRVYVDHPAAPGPKMDNGATGYYDAPMTKNGSADPNDTVVAIDIAKAMDYMGNMGVLANAVTNPAVAERLAQGAKEKGTDAQKYIDDLTALSRPTKKVTSTDKVDLGDRTLMITRDETGKEISREELRKGAAPRLFAPARAGGAAGEPTLDDETLTSMAEQYLAGDKSVFQNLGRGAQGAANVVALRQRVTRVAKEAGMSPDQVALAQAEFTGMGAAQRSLGARSANFGLAEKEAYAMADLVTEASSKVPRTQFMPINKAIMAYENNTGDPQARQFGAALNSFINAYARAVSPIGTPTVSDKDHARSMLSTADSHEALTAIMGQLKREMDAAGAAPGAVQKQMRERQSQSAARVTNRGGGARMPTFGSEADAAAAAKAGKIKPGDRITINGQTGTWQ